jgi:RHS repeat-associated protein
MTISYDSSNRISTVQDALGKETSFSYNANGYVETVTDPFERSAGFEYDGSGRLTKATDMGGYWASYTYDTNGYLASVTTAKGTWTFKTEPSDSASGAAAYPAPDASMGKKYRITITNPLSGKEEYFYDGVNSWYVSPRDYIAYQDETVNNRNRAVKTYYTMERYPSGSSSPKGRIFKITTPERNERTYYYDDSTGSNQISGYSYTDTGRVITVTDGNSHTVKYAYNTSGFRTKYWDAKTEMSSAPNVELAYYSNNIDLQTATNGLGSVAYEYNTAHDITKITDRMGYISVLTYNSYGQLSTITEAQGTSNETLTELVYDTDTHKLLTIKKAGVVIATLTHDSIGRIKTVTYPWDSGATITYDYNELNQLTGITPLLGTAVGYTYDTMGRLKTIQRTTDTTPFTYGYDTTNLANPLVQKLTRPNGSYTTYEYNDQLKKLTSIINMTSANEIINRYDYTYTNPSHPDLRNSETITSGTVIDNFTAGTTTYTPNSVNQTTASTNPSRTYVYDNDGNMTTGFNPDNKTMTMTYDAEDRLSSAQYTDSSSVVQKTTYDYSGDGLLAVMYKYSGGVLQTTTRYVRAGFLPIQERDASNNVTREYTWGLNHVGGIGGLLNLKQGGNDYNYLYDGKGNVTALIDSTQSPVVTYAYDPFGVRMKQVGTFEQPYQFSTKPYDPQTGLSNFGYRYYNAGLGKWMTRDPLGEAGGINLYGFVGGNPVNWVDLFGLEVNLNLFNQNEFVLYTSAQNIPSDANFYLIASHGSAQSIYFNGRSWTADQFADYLLNNTDYSPGTPIRLLGCNMGKGKNPFAEQLSKILGVQVEGAIDYMWFYADDTYFVGPAASDKMGNSKLKSFK